jgi:uncharacterized protein
MRYYRYLLIFFTIFVASLAQAAYVADLNVASVAVKNTSVAERQSALPAALAQVLIKMSGNPAIMTLPAVQDAVDQVSDLLQSYSYATQVQPDGASQRQLQVAFDQKALAQLLRKAGQAVWSDHRPLTLLWWKLQGDQGADVISSASDALLLRDIRQDAKQRGVPVLLPAMDLQDQAFLNNQPGQFLAVNALSKVAKRYDAPAILAGNVQKNGGQWQGKWLLLVQGTPYRWLNSASTLEGLAKQAVNDMANLLANQLTVSDDKGMQTQVLLDVGDVARLGDYARVMSVLKHLMPVASVVVRDMSGSHLLLEVKAIGGVQALTQALSSQSELTSEDVDQQQSADLYYRWKPRQSRSLNG